MSKAMQRPTPCHERHAQATLALARTAFASAVSSMRLTVARDWNLAVTVREGS